MAPSPDWWIPPPPGWIKLNFGGSFNQATGKSGIGGLIRDPFGNLLMAFTAEVCAHTPLEAELLALQRGVVHLREMAASNVQIEGDCLAIISNIQKSENLAWDIMPLWQETMTMLSSLTTWSIHYCKRSANSAADLLAKLILAEVSEGQTSLPPDVREALNDDKKRAAHYTTSFFNNHMGCGRSINEGDNVNSSVASNDQGGDGSFNPADNVSSTS